MKKCLNYIIFIVLVNFLPISSIFAQFYNGSQMSFGKNRVQYKDFLWTYYRYPRFDTYFYLEGKPLALYTANFTENVLTEFENLLDFQLEDKLQFIIFNKYTHYKQTNLGLLTDDFGNTGGVTQIIGSKVFLYFDGTYRNFEKQIKAGIARVMINQMIYGSSFFSNLKNEALMTLPQWYTEGLISFLSENWSTETDNIMRDAFLQKRFKKFNNLTGKDAVLAGHSFWNYIAVKNGKNVIHNIVHLTRISKSVERGFQYVLGKSSKELIQDWQAFYNEKYSLLQSDSYIPPNPLKIKFKEGIYYGQARVSPDATQLAYISNDQGLYKVWLYQIQSGKKKKILKSGIRLSDSPDISYPLIAWHPSGKMLSIIIEHKSETIIYFYTPEGKTMEKRFIYQFEKILDFSYSPNGKNMIMSAVKKGQSDIYVYNIAANTIEQITDDIYDDLNPRFSQNGKSIFFSSNRKNDTLKNTSFLTDKNIKFVYDVFMYNYAKKSKVLLNITNTDFSNEILPMPLEGNIITYLSDRNNIYNRFFAKIDSTISFIDTTTHYRYYTSSFPVTDNNMSILEQDFNLKAKKNTQLVFSRNKYRFTIEDILPSNEYSPLILNKKGYNGISELTIDNIYDTTAKKAVMISLKKFRTVYENEVVQQPDSNQIDINNYMFGKQAYLKLGSLQDSSALNAFIIPKQRNYDVEYFINELITQADFSFLNTGYQLFSGGNSPIFLNPGFNGLFMVGATDLMEDHRIIGGFRISSNLENTEFILSYSNLKKRLDKEYTFHRVSSKIIDEQNMVYIKLYTNEGFYVLKWPFNEFLALKGTLTLRNDKLVVGSTDLATLKYKNIYENRGAIKGELIYDATRSLGTNLYRGLRYKIFAEHYQLIDKNTSNLTVWGGDFRYYHKIHRTLIWANRLAFSGSFGKSKLIYYLGGVDNWMLPKFNPDIPIDNTQNYMYQTLATNLRGFSQNIRNGTNFAVLNSELRLPIFRYIFNRPIKSELLNSFQVVGFADAGTAWSGWNPFSDKNTLFNRVVDVGPITVTYVNKVNPIVGGFGVGLRASLLGYFVRTDWAWGIEDGTIGSCKFYISLSLDF